MLNLIAFNFILIGLCKRQNYYLSHLKEDSVEKVDKTLF
jgi:hypothetical protein